MSFLKTGDGKIINVLDDKNMTEEQKKALKDSSKQISKQSTNDQDASEVKNSGR
jgi:hypothetical protein